MLSWTCGWLGPGSGRVWLNCVGDWRVSEQMSIMKTKIVMGRWGSRRELGRWHRSGSGQSATAITRLCWFPHWTTPFQCTQPDFSFKVCVCVCAHACACVRELDKDWNDTSQSVTGSYLLVVRWWLMLFYFFIFHNEHIWLPNKNRSLQILDGNNIRATWCS